MNNKLEAITTDKEKLDLMVSIAKSINLDSALAASRSNGVLFSFNTIIQELLSLALSNGDESAVQFLRRSIAFVAALSVALTYLSENGYISHVTTETYLKYLELDNVEELAWEHNGKYGDMFDEIVRPLRAFLITIPAYDKAKIKEQDVKTMEHHGYITMQLTRYLVCDPVVQ